MPSKPIIAIDIDDVLSAHVEAMIAYSNEQYGSNLTIEDYDEHWTQMWKVDEAEGERRAADYHTSGTIDSYRHRVEALPVLKKLHKRYSLVVVTSRQIVVQRITEEWLAKYYKDIFDELYLAGIWDSGDYVQAAKATKAELCKKIGASYLIDDQLKHCSAAAEMGIEAIVFGDYPWNQSKESPAGVTRCKDWAAVKEYFDV